MGFRGDVTLFRLVLAGRTRLRRPLAARGRGSGGRSCESVDPSLRLPGDNRFYASLAGNPSEYDATAVVGERPLLPFPRYGWVAMEGRVKQWAVEVKRDMASA
jgi:hypothetical protein